jgi:hypothetical protein
MVAGSISRIVNSFGATWGHVRPVSEPRQIFFNADSLVPGLDFAHLSVGDRVELDEEVDRANGMRAINLRRTAAASAAVASDEAMVL